MSFATELTANCECDRARTTEVAAGTTVGKSALDENYDLDCSVQGGGAVGAASRQSSMNSGTDTPTPGREYQDAVLGFV